MIRLIKEILCQEGLDWKEFAKSAAREYFHTFVRVARNMKGNKDDVVEEIRTALKEDKFLLALKIYRREHVGASITEAKEAVNQIRLQMCE